jgi:ATP/maltotriose-dependent transcriptional regulator MalT
VSTPLLTTTLYLPLIPLERVSCLRLTRDLDSGLCAGQRLTLVSAPAGFLRPR